LYTWLVDTIFGRAKSEFYLIHIKNPLIFFSGGFRVFIIETMQWFSYIEGIDYAHK